MEWMGGVDDDMVVISKFFWSIMFSYTHTHTRWNMKMRCRTRNIQKI
jgi:hypothetical protein